MIYLIVFAILIWFLCGVLGAGIAFAHFQNKFPDSAIEDRRQDLAFSYGPILFGPITLMVALFMSRFCEYGIKFK